MTAPRRITVCGCISNQASLPNITAKPITAALVDTTSGDAIIHGMGIPAELDTYPLCRLFLSGYLTNKEDPDNFPPKNPKKFEQYERLFASALQALGLQREELRRRPEFNFDSASASNLESAIAVLRAVVLLRQKSFLDIALIRSTPTTGADITCERHGLKVCCEVKTITRQSAGRAEFYLEDQVYEKLRENIPKARAQLKASAAVLHCNMTIAVFVVNWSLQSVTMDRSKFQEIINRLKQDQELDGIDAVLVITATGQDHIFFSERGKSIKW